MHATDSPRALTVGQLCLGGDWACAHGDVSALRFVARQLAAYVHEPLHCELAALVEACTCDPDHAVSLWSDLKDRVYRSSTS